MAGGHLIEGALIKFFFFNIIKEIKGDVKNQP